MARWHMSRFLSLSIVIRTNLLNILAILVSFLWLAVYSVKADYCFKVYFGRKRKKFHCMSEING